MKQVKDLHSIILSSVFASEKVRYMVQEPEYYTQIMHHATVSDVIYVLLIVAAQTKVQYATMTYFPSTEWIVMRSIFHDMYGSTLKRTYVNAQESNDPAQHISDFIVISKQS